MQSSAENGYAHVAYDLYGCDAAVLTDAASALAGLIEACHEARLNVVNSLIHSYPNGAYSISIFLSESHISLHTWPEHSYGALDIFLCRGNIQKTEDCVLGFLRPATKYKINLLRGGNCELRISNATATRGQPGQYEVYETNRSLVRFKSPYQLIEIVESKRFGKLLLLDGDIQLSTSDEHIYHELLVHPAMQAQKVPVDVLIIGGGDGGALREILKYSSVNRAVLVDIDAQVISSCRKYLREISNGAFDDPRVKILYTDAALFRPEHQFDLVVVDLTAPQGISLPAYQSLSQRADSLLKPEGLLAVHSGWWLGSGVDYPSLLLEQFDHVLLRDQWIPSFACFWSFMFAWKHNVKPEAVLCRIADGQHKIKTSHFNAREFVQGAFISP